MAGSRAGEAPRRPIGAGVAPVRYRGRTLWLVWRPERTGGRILRPRHLDAARALLRELLLDDRNGAPVQRVLREATPGSASTVASNEADLDHAARLMESGRLALVEPAAPEEKSQGHTAPVSTPAPEEEAAAPAAKPKSKTYFKLQVVLDASGRALPGVRLRVTLPDGVENYYTTNGSGEIDIQNINRGECDLKSDRKGILLPDTFQVIKVAKDAAPADPSSQETVSGGSIRFLALVEAHKVKSGESIKSLAEGVGLKWQELAKFNWGTDVPEEINKHLVEEVGCTKKTKDGYNYMFHESDNPGIVYIPRVWSAEGLSTGETHIIRVKVVSPIAGFALIVPVELDPDGDPSTDDQVRIRAHDGSFERIIKSSDPAVVRDDDRRLLLYNFGRVPTEQYILSVFIKDQWVDALYGLEVTPDGAKVRGRAVGEDLNELNLGKPDDIAGGRPEDRSDLGDPVPVSEIFDEEVLGAAREEEEG